MMVLLLFEAHVERFQLRLRVQIFNELFVEMVVESVASSSLLCACDRAGSGHVGVLELYTSDRSLWRA